MKAEERKRLERNVLADKLTHAWEGVATTSPKSNRVWTIILAVLVVALIWVVYSRYSTGRDTGLWTRLDTSFEVDQLKSLAKEFPNSTQGQIARFQLARVEFSDGVGKLATQSADEREKAANNIESAKSSYVELAKISSLPSVMIQEAMMQIARADEVLASVPKANEPGTMRSTIDQAIKGYEELKNKFPKSLAGEQAAKQADDLRKKKDELTKLNAELARDHSKSPAMPSLPVGVIPEAPPLPKLPPLIPPTTEAPKSESPKTDAPKGETPKNEPGKSDPPK